MEKQAFEAIDAETSIETIKKILEKVNLNKLLKIIRQEALQQSEKAILILQSIFQNAECVVHETSSPHFKTYQFCLSLLQQVDLPNSAVSELVGILLLEADKLSAQNLGQLSMSFLDSIKDGSMFDKWIVIFPKILTTISLQDSVVHDQDNYSGKDFKNHLINSLLNIRWQSSSAIHLITILREVALEPDELSRAVSKVFNMLPDLDINELPPLFFQLLQLCAKGHRSQVLKGIISFFNKKNERLEAINDENSYDSEMINNGSDENFDTVRATEGTVILHISFAAKQDQDLGKEFIKILKVNKFNSDSVLSPFCLALALAIAKIQGFEEQIFDILKRSILRSFQEQEKKQEYFWIRQLFSSEANAHKRVISTVHYSTFGWDHITDGLVSLGLNLIESYATKGTRVRDDFTSEKTCKLGQDLLIETFKVHSIIRSSMLEQILDRVICRDVDSVVNYTGVLSAMVEHSPHVFTGSLNKVQEAIYCLPFLSHATAMGLLEALMPLLKVSLTLRDALMFTLRKALFNREIEARKVAISGHLLILKCFKVLGGAAPLSQTQSSQSSSISLSQVLVDVHIAKHNKGANEALCLELLSTLQKTLTQQAEARQLLYQSIPIVMKKNPSLSGAVLELLFTQFQKYYEWSQDIKPPLKLDKCVQIKLDEPVLMEPLSNLLHSIQLCLFCAERKASEDEFFSEEIESPNSTYKKLSSTMKVLVARMIHTDVEDFNLDKTTDFGYSSVGIKNQLIAEQLLGCYESLMEYSYNCVKEKKGNFKKVLDLFHKYHSLAEVVREKSGSEKKGEKEKKNEGSDEKAGKDQKKTAKDKRKKMKPLVTILSLEVLSNIVWSLYYDSSGDDTDHFMLLKNDEPFVTYLIHIACQTIATYKEKNNSSQHEAEKNASHFGLLARALIKHYSDVHGAAGNLTQTSQQGPRGNKQAVKTQNTTEGLDCLANIVTFFCKHSPKQLHIFLVALKTSKPATAASLSNSPFQDILRSIIKHFQKLVLSVLAHDDDKYLRDIVPILTVIQVLSEHLQDGFDQDLFKWTTQLCKQQNISDIQVGRALLSLSFDLCHKNKTSISFCEEIADNIHKVFGDIDEEVQLSADNTFGVISQSTAVNLGIMVVQELDGVINQYSWVLDQIKGDSMTDTGVTTENPSSKTSSKREKELCIQLGSWVSASQPILQTAWPLGAVLVSILKLVTHFFNFLTGFAKYEISLYTDRTGHMTSYFEKVVKICALHLTPKIYSFITYAETVEREKGAKVKPKTGTGKFQGGNKAVPILICAIEQYERCLLSLSKKSKVNLMDHLKRSTARDFRIIAETVQNALRTNDASDEENTTQNENDENQGENQGKGQVAPSLPPPSRPPTAKRGRRKLGTRR